LKLLAPLHQAGAASEENTETAVGYHNESSLLVLIWC
jgi:hypothetical protein